MTLQAAKRLVLVTAFVCVHLLGSLHCRTVTGVFSTAKAKYEVGQYLTTFCFHGDTAQIQYKLNDTGTGNSHLKLYLFLDEDWLDAKESVTCQRKLDLARTIHYMNGTEGQLVVTHFLQPRTWHIVYADSYTCDHDRPIATLGEKPNNVQYTLTLLNPDYYNNATDHFSDEETGLYRFYQLLTLGYFVLGCIYAPKIMETLQKKGPMHLVLQLLTCALTLQATASVVTLLHLRSYSRDGIGSPFFELLAEMMDVTSQFVMLYMMLSLSLGWSMAAAYKYHHSTLAQLKEKPAAKFVAVIGVLQALIFVWEQYEEREHRMYHAHRSISGAALVLVRVLLAAIFALNLYYIVLKERSALKREFYINFTKCCMMWFLCYPFLVFISWMLPPYMRYKFVTMTVVLCQSSAVIFLYRLFISRSLYWEVSALSSTLPLRMDKGFGLKLYS